MIGFCNGVLMKNATWPRAMRGRERVVASTPGESTAKRTPCSGSRSPVAADQNNVHCDVARSTLSAPSQTWSRDANCDVIYINWSRVWCRPWWCRRARQRKLRRSFSGANELQSYIRNEIRQWRRESTKRREFTGMHICLMEKNLF